MREGDLAGAQMVAEGFDSLACKADGEEQSGAGSEREELTPERAGSRGVQRQGDGAGRQGCLPADVREEVEANERAEDEGEEDGGGVRVEDELGVRMRIHEVLPVYG